MNTKGNLDKLPTWNWLPKIQKSHINQVVSQTLVPALRLIYKVNYCETVQTTLFISALDTTTKFFIMTIRL